jgi:phage terminase large subunit
MYEIMRNEFGVDPNNLEREMQLLNWYYRGNLLHLGAVDDPEKIKSTEWNYVWMEEATDFDLVDYRALKLRLSGPTPDEINEPNQIFLSFNPVDVFHWIKTKLIDVDPDVDEIISSYLDNPSLSESYKRELMKLKDQDPNYYRIYVLGEWGKLDNLVYPSGWEVVPDEAWPESFDEVIYGVDFGFTYSETAVLKIGFLGDRVWEEEKLYAQGFTNNDLIDFLRDDLKDAGDPLVYADSAEPARIEDLRRAGVNVVDADKRPGSVNAGIDKVKENKIMMKASSTSLINERRGYSWRKDKNGNPIDVPIGHNDHLMAAERMALLTHLQGAGDVRVWTVGA